MSNRGVPCKNSLRETSNMADQSGEKEFLAAYDAYADALFRHARFRVRDKSVAEDLVQEAFCRAWTHIAKGGEPVRNVRAFLYRILGNLIIDRARKAKEESLDALLDDGFQVAGDCGPSADVAADAKTAVEVLGRLEEPYRTAVAMRFLDDLPPREIAEILGVSAVVVSVRIHRGIAKLRQMIETKRTAS
jgi:RNA polymerase sigma-70 factor, ECF subfamily